MLSGLQSIDEAGRRRVEADERYSSLLTHQRSSSMAAASSSSSSRGSPASYASIDSTYTSLYSLLCAPASSSKHLCLLPPNALYSSITLYLSRLREATLPDFVKVVATSRSLWESPCIIKAGEGRIHEDVTQLPSSEPNSGQASVEPSLASRSYQIQLATARACFSHVELLLATGKGSTGWGTQRKLRHWVNQINSSLNEAAAPLTPLMQDIDIPRLSILTGLVIGLSAYRQQSRDAGTKPEQRLSVRLALHAAERYWLEAFGQAMQSLMDMQSPPVASASQPSASLEDDWEREFKKSNVELEAVEAARRADRAREASLVPLLLAGQVAPLLSDSGLTSLSPEAILRLIPLSILPLFSRPLLHLSSNPQELRNPTTHALFPCLGPLSRLLASAAETAVLKMRGNDVQALLLGSADTNSAGALSQIVDLATQLERDFASSNYLSAAAAGSEAEAQLTDTWKSLKSLLFVAVQLFDAVLDALVTTLPSPVTTIHEPAVWVAQWQQQHSQDATSAASLPTTTTNIPPHVLEILKLQVLGLMRLSFVTFSITSGGEGSNGSEALQRAVTSNDIYNRFTTYRHAFYGSLEVIRSDWAAATTLYEELLRASEGLAASSSSAPPPAWVTRSRLVVLLDSAEQLLVSLPGSILSDSLLPLCRPHLLPSYSSSGGADVATFESSHACLLALFEAKRPQRLVKDVMPFYVEALLKGHAQGLITGAGEADDGDEGGGQVGQQGQLSHALCTVVACMSDVDDARCYWVVKRLEEEVRARTGKEQQRQRLDVQLALVDLLPVVNLVLLRSVLGTVRGYILEEKPATALLDGEETAEDGSSKAVDVKGKGRASDESSEAVERSDAVAAPITTPPSSPAHALLCSRTFNALNSMDDTARQEGVRWWLDHRREFGV